MLIVRLANFPKMIFPSSPHNLSACLCPISTINATISPPGKCHRKLLYSVVRFQVHPVVHPSRHFTNYVIAFPSRHSHSAPCSFNNRRSVRRQFVRPSAFFPRYYMFVGNVGEGSNRKLCRFPSLSSRVFVQFPQITGCQQTSIRGW